MLQIFNYVKLFGACVNSSQLILLDPNTRDRQEKKMIEEASTLVSKGWDRRLALLQQRADKHDEQFDEETERAAFFPKTMEDGRIAMPLQYVYDYMVRKMAAIQNNTSIHNKKEVAELTEIFGLYEVKLYPKLENLTVEKLSWQAREGQKPKLLVHTKAPAPAGEEGDTYVIRFEAASELAPKFMEASKALDLKPGQRISLAFEAVDPAIERNKRVGKEVAKPGLYVNHNLTVTLHAADGSVKTHTGHPPKGTRFQQKRTIEELEVMFMETRAQMDGTTPPVRRRQQQPQQPATA